MRGALPNNLFIGAMARESLVDSWRAHPAIQGPSRG